MKKTFEMPEIEIVRFETEAVLSDSSAPSNNGGGNGMGWLPKN